MRRRGERGETLVEVLVSTTLLGIIGFGIIGAIASVLISTDIDRRVSAGETVLRSYVAAIEAADYVACAGPNAYSSQALGFGPPERPDNFTAEVTDVAFLQTPATSRPLHRPGDTVPLAFGPNCSSDPGVQQLDIQVQSTGARHTTEHITIVKRRVVTP